MTTSPPADRLADVPSATASRWAAVPAVLAGPLTVTGLLLGLALVDFDAEAFRDPETVLALGSDGAAVLRRSYLLVMLGSYALLLPLALELASRFGRAADPRWRLVTASGGAYLLLGAAGSAMLAAVWPDLIEQHAQAGSDHEALLVSFRAATRLAEDGLQGVLQNLAGAVWWLGLGLAQRRAGWRRLGALTLLLGVASAANAVGGLLSLEALVMVGLSLTVLLVPVWAVLTGLRLLRS